MAAYLFQFRQLYEALLDAQGADVAMLENWAARHAAILAPLAELRRFNAPDNFYRVESDDLESLYALSRVCDTLILPFQSGECWFDLSRRQFADFWQTLGIAAREVSEYHPFWCEIVACKNGPDGDAPPVIEDLLWPALTWGDLLICRAGVKIEAGRNWMNAAVADSSPLYFASRRSYRAARDLSHGWGSNSQWGTDFRRDYVWGEHYIFNSDGERNWDEPFLRNLSAHEWAELLVKPRQFFASDKGDFGELSLIEREELLVNRCLVRSTKEDKSDFWPYDDVAVWKRTARLRA